MGMKSCCRHHCGHTPTSCPPARGFSLGWDDKQPDSAILTPSTWYVVSQKFQDAICTIRVTAESERELKFSPWLPMLSRLTSLQRRSLLKGGVAKDVLRKGLFMFAYSQNGPRVKPIVAALPSLIYFKLTYTKT